MSLDITHLAGLVLSECPPRGRGPRVGGGCRADQQHTGRPRADQQHTGRPRTDEQHTGGFRLGRRPEQRQTDRWKVDR
ncbi:hypothetical protein [Dietzia alimentaria]|uniref:hypothetical protein n=1 Tax=Dietzia alimentaria TaxID=665550 RepID=UPI0011456FCB|nr:hypothetical protein [Dietzia alimentaria]